MCRGLAAAHPCGWSQADAGSTAVSASSMAREVDRLRQAPICAFSSTAFCLARPIASAPATKRRGGCSWPAMISSPWASLASPCWPFWAFHDACVSAVRGA